MYTVKRLADLAGISVRTLHYYDEIALLKPTQIAANGYRHYDEQALLRLQQILIYREIGLELLEIKAILDSPNFDILAALRSHQTVLQEKKMRLGKLIQTVDNMIKHMEGKQTMSHKQMFEPFTAEEQEHYARAARLQYGADMVNASIQRWNSYSKEKQEAILAEAGQIYTDIAQAIDDGYTADSPDVQAMLERWQANLNHFYEPSIDIMRGLGENYNSDPTFIANFQKIHPELPAYLQAAISHYVNELEHQAIVRLLAEDEGQA